MRQILILLALTIIGCQSKVDREVRELKDSTEALQKQFERERFESASREEQERILRRMQFNNLNK